jgi:hypothetical protein
MDVTPFLPEFPTLVPPIESRVGSSHGAQRLPAAGHRVARPLHCVAAHLLSISMLQEDRTGPTVPTRTHSH